MRLMTSHNIYMHVYTIFKTEMKLLSVFTFFVHILLISASKHEMIREHLLADAIANTAAAVRSHDSIENGEELLQILDQSQAHIQQQSINEDIDASYESAALPSADDKIGKSLAHEKIGKPALLPSANVNKFGANSVHNLLLNENIDEAEADDQADIESIRHAKDMVCDLHHVEGVGSKLLCYALDLNEIKFSKDDCSPGINGHIVCEKNLFSP